MTYFSTFISGTEKIIEKVLGKRFGIKSLLDGLVIYETDHQLRDIRALRFFNNTFILLKQFESTPIPEMVKSVIKDKRVINGISEHLPKGRKTFRVIASKENQTVSVDKGLLSKLEKQILNTTNLELNIKKPDLEFWFLERSEGMGFFGLRITYPLPSDKPEKGQLRHELAHVLCLASKPSPKDVFLDPFAGSGAIPLERAGYFPFKKVIAADNNVDMVEELKSKSSKVETLVENAMELKQIKDASVDKIVTDPPWGIYEKTKIPLEEFYAKMLESFHRVLRPDGVAVLLIARKELFESLLNKFELIEKHDILVSGKKAAIYKLKKA